MTCKRLVGRLSNEASQDNEGNPYYCFLDDTKSGEDAVVDPKVGDTLIVHDKGETHTIVLRLPLKERNFLKFNPPIRTYWFDKGYRADLLTSRADEPVPQTDRFPPRLKAWGFEPKALDLVSKERERFGVQHGGDVQDDQRTTHDWLMLVARQMGRLAYPTSRGDVAKFHLRVLTKIAAISMAGVESIIRKNNL